MKQTSQEHNNLQTEEFEFSQLDREVMHARKAAGFHTTNEGESVPVFTGPGVLPLVEVSLYTVESSEDKPALGLRGLPKREAIPLLGGLIAVTGQLKDGQLEAMGIRRVCDEKGAPVSEVMFAQTYRSVLEPCSFSLTIPIFDGVPRLLGDSGPATAGIDAETTRVRVAFCALQYKGVGCYDYERSFVERGQLTQFHEVLSEKHCASKSSPLVRVVDTRFRGRCGIMLPVVYQMGQDPVGGQSTQEQIVFERQQRILEKAFESGEGCNTDSDARNRFRVLSNVLLRIIPIADRSSLPELSSKDLCVAEYAVQNDTRRLSCFSNPSLNLDDRRDEYRRFVVEKYAPRPPESANIAEYVKEHFEASRDLHLSDLFANASLMTKALLEAGYTNPRDQELCGNIDVVGGIADLADLAEMDNPHQAIGFLGYFIAAISEFGKAADFPDRAIFRTPGWAQFLESTLGGREHKVLSFVRSPYFLTGGKQTERIRIIKLAALMTDAWAEKQGAAPEGAYYLDDEELMRALISSSQREKLREDWQQPDSRCSLQDRLDFWRADNDGRMGRVASISESSEAVKARLWGRA